MGSRSVQTVVGCKATAHTPREAAECRGPTKWTVEAWTEDRCPRCGSQYFEWLSYDFEPEDVYLRTEHARVPQGRVSIRKLGDGLSTGSEGLTG